jgi:hypothetical protein
MILSTPAVLDKPRTILQIAEDLAAFANEAAQKGLSLDVVERRTLQMLLQIGHASVDIFLETQGDGDLGPTANTKEGSVLHRSPVVVDRRVRTIFGEHSFSAYVYSAGSKKKIELRPIDARINLPETKASYLLQEFTQLFCVEKAFAVGAKQFEAIFGQKISVDVLENINRAMGDQAERFLEELPKPPAKEEGAILVVTADGKGVPLVQEEAKKVPAFDKLERPGNRRMATLGCVYTVDPFVRTPEQIAAALFRDPKEKPPSDRLEACFKHYRGYFAQKDQGEGDDIPGAYRTWTWLAGEVASRRQGLQPIVTLMDGQPILWEAAEACLEEFVGKLKEAGELQPVIEILDILHAAGYVWKAAKAFYSHAEQQEAFAQDRVLRILRGEVAGVVTGMRRMASQRGLIGDALKAVEKACRYFENNAARMRYDEYLKAGYPIASGVIEGACRHVIKDRMEQGGMRWTLSGAEAMLAVRSVCASCEWENFNVWRQAEEAKRVHPHRELVANYKELKA